MIPLSDFDEILVCCVALHVVYRHKVSSKSVRSFLRKLKNKKTWPIWRAILVFISKLRPPAHRPDTEIIDTDYESRVPGLPGKKKIIVLRQWEHPEKDAQAFERPWEASQSAFQSAFQIFSPFCIFDSVPIVRFSKFNLLLIARVMTIKGCKIQHCTSKTLAYRASQTQKSRNDVFQHFLNPKFFGQNLMSILKALW